MCAAIEGMKGVTVLFLKVDVLENIDFATTRPVRPLSEDCRPDRALGIKG